MRLKNKKILITGGTGFIGSNLTKRLKELGADVTIFDLALGHDIQNQSELSSFIKKNFDAIYHLAGFSGSEKSNRHRLKSFKVNTIATVNICEFLVKYSPKTKLIISSSRLEYGKPIYLPVDENHPTLPMSTYGLSKLAATQMALIYHKKDNLDVTVFRTSNVYGYHQNTKFAGYNIINHFIDLARQDRAIKIFGNGNQERDYLFIDDLLRAFILAISQKAAGKIYNLGQGRPIKFKDMAKLIVQKVGLGKVVFTKWPKQIEEVETGGYISDISKIKKELGFYPKVDFEEGIARTLESNAKRFIYDYMFTTAWY